MQKLTVRLEIADFERAQSLADSAGVSVPMHMRQVYLDHLQGLEMTAQLRQVLEHFLAQTTAQLQGNFRKQIELVDALDDRLTKSQADFLHSLAQAVGSEKAGYRPPASLFPAIPSTSKE